MNRRRYELIATTGEWTDGNGQKHKKTAVIGTVFESPNGKLSARIELIPILPSWSGFVAFREVQPSARTPEQDPPA